MFKKKTTHTLTERFISVAKYFLSERTTNILQGNNYITRTFLRNCTHSANIAIFKNLSIFLKNPPIVRLLQLNCVVFLNRQTNCFFSPNTNYDPHKIWTKYTICPLKKWTFQNHWPNTVNIKVAKQKTRTHLTSDEPFLPL